MQIESLEQACEVLKVGKPEEIMPDFSMYPEKHRGALKALAEMILISDASRSQDPDWNNMGERKWFSWADMEKDKNNPSGFRFRAAYYVSADTAAGLGSRLCFESSEDAEWHFKKHEDRMRAILVIGG